MRPILFTLGDFPVHSYNVMLFLAFVAAGIVMWLEFRRRGWDTGDVSGHTLAAAGGGIAGAWVYGAIQQGTVSGVGLVFFGGLAGGTLAVILNALRKPYSIAALADVPALAVPLAYAVGRIGCFLHGDDYGVPTDVPWGIAFPLGSPPTTAAVHPTQLYEAAAGVAIFLILSARRARSAPDGLLWFEMMVLLGVERFVVEFWRRNPPVALGLTAAQGIALGLVLGGALGWRALRRRNTSRAAGLKRFHHK